MVTGAGTDPIQLQFEYLQRRIDDLETRSIERLVLVKEATAAALAASERAITKAETATDKRFDGVNEFRQALSNQSNEFVRNATYNTSHQSLINKTDMLSNQLIALDTMVRSAPKPISGPTFLIGVGSVAFAFVIALITGAIQLGAVQTHIEINTAAIGQLQQFERDHNALDNQQASDISTIKARQGIFEDRMEKHEAHIGKLYEKMESSKN